MDALDRQTGEEVWRVEVENSKRCGFNITSAPLVVKDLVITCVTGGESAHRSYINAFDARSGRHRWRFWTIPGPGEPAHETWAGDSWVYGGGSTWVTGTYDPELDLLYWAVGNPAADFYGGDREGDNLYTDLIVALDPDTGQLQWHYQQIPHDVWAYDTAYEMVLLDDPVTGERKWRYRHKYPLLASQLATAGGPVFSGDATGRFFALDAVDGRELWSFRTGSGHRGSAVTHAVGGRQYIATPSGWGSALAGLTTQLWPEAEDFPSGSSVFVFALPE